MMSLRFVVQALVFFLGICRIFDIALTASAMDPNLVNNGGFEEMEGSFPVGVLVPVSSSNPGIVVPGWDVEDGAVEIISSRLWQKSSKNSLYAIHLNSREGPGAMQTEIPTQFSTGALYHLTFALAGSPLGGPSVKRLEIGFSPSSCHPRQVSIIVPRGANPEQLDWKTIRMVFAVEGGGESVTMKFRSLTSGPYGPLVDNVRLVRLQRPSRHHPALYDLSKNSRQIQKLTWIQSLFENLRIKFDNWSSEHSGRRSGRFRGHARKMHPQLRRRNKSFGNELPNQSWMESLFERLRIDVEIWFRERFLRPADM